MPAGVVGGLTPGGGVRRLQRLGGTVFHHSSKDALLVYSRVSADGTDVLLCVVNLDPEHWQEDTLHLDLEALGIATGAPVLGAATVTSYPRKPSPLVVLEGLVETQIVLDAVYDDTVTLSALYG